MFEGTYKNSQEIKNLIDSSLPILQNKYIQANQGNCKFQQIHEIEGLLFFLKKLLENRDLSFSLTIKLFEQKDNAPDALITTPTQHYIVEVTAPFVQMDLDKKLNDLYKELDIPLAGKFILNATNYNNYIAEKTKDFEAKCKNGDKEYEAFCKDINTVLVLGHFYMLPKENIKDKLPKVEKELLKKINKDNLENRIGYKPNSPYFRDHCMNLLSRLSVVTNSDDLKGIFEILKQSFIGKSSKSFKYDCCTENINHQKILIIKNTFYPSQVDLKDFFKRLREEFQKFLTSTKAPEHKFSSIYVISSIKNNEDYMEIKIIDEGYS